MASLKRKAGAELAAAVDPKKAKQQQQSSLMSFFASPKPAANGSGSSTNGGKLSTAVCQTNGPKFDKAKWVAKLTDEQRRLLKLEIDTLGESWLAVLKDDLTSTSFLDLKRFLQREHDAGRKIFPPATDIYSWSRYTPLSSVKVVIVGQDPYHNHGQAHGLAFSVKPPIPAPPSLKNMYVALRNDYPDSFAPPPPQAGGLLTPWAERGVLMLNTCLTVRAHEANSHANHGWERFTQRVLDVVAQRRAHGVVFMAWGSPAAKRVAKIDSKRHLVLRSVHPSPLSAHRGFFECRHFRTANEWLIKRYGPSGEIDWSLLEGTSTLPKPVAKPEVEEEKPKAEVEPAEVKPVEVKPVEAKPAETKPAETKPAETKPAETKPAETKPAEAKPAEAKVETKPVDMKPVETKPTETKETKTKETEAPTPQKDVKAIAEEEKENAPTTAETKPTA